jgi:hypothetical protein
MAFLRVVDQKKWHSAAEGVCALSSSATGRQEPTEQAMDGFHFEIQMRLR